MTCISFTSRLQGRKAGGVPPSPAIRRVRRPPNVCMGCLVQPLRQDARISSKTLRVAPELLSHVRLLLCCWPRQVSPLLHARPLCRLFYAPWAGHKAHTMGCVKHLAETTSHRVTDSCCCSFQDREGLSAGDGQRRGKVLPGILYYTAQLR